MRVAIAELESQSPLSFSKFYKVEKKEGENSEDFEKRTWRERLHTNEEGIVLIPPMMFKNCLSAAAQYLGAELQVKGEGKARYVKNIEAGIIVNEPSLLGIKKENVLYEWVHVPTDGRRGGTKRVEKCFAVIESWKATVKFYVLDEKIKEDIFKKCLETAGNFVGIGRFRPRNNGYYGRFKVNSIKWVEE